MAEIKTMSRSAENAERSPDTKKHSLAHMQGHRQRLRQRFLDGGTAALADYELLELLLFAAHPRGDVKPLAKALIVEFKTVVGVLRAEPKALRAVEGMGDAAVAALKVNEALMQRMLWREVEKQPVLSSWHALLDYCHLTMAHEKIEQFRIFYLNNKNELIADEKQQTGTVDHTPVYVREVVKRGLELGATAMILAHNHPSGDVAPSNGDIEMTQRIVQAAEPLGLKVHDHIIVSRRGHFSFKSQGLI